VTARALAIYDPDYPNGRDGNGSDLTAERQRSHRRDREAAANPDSRPREATGMAGKGLRRVEAELALRESVLDSDLTWRSWISDEKTKDDSGDSSAA
jgi:hypothetical protein